MAAYDLLREYDTIIKEAIDQDNDLKLQDLLFEGYLDPSNPYTFNYLIYAVNNRKHKAVEYLGGIDYYNEVIEYQYKQFQKLNEKK